MIQEKDGKGEVKRTKSDTDKYSNEKAVKIKAGIPADLLKQIANRLQTKSNYNGYEGNITAFLEPASNKGDIAEIDGFDIILKNQVRFLLKRYRVSLELLEVGKQLN
ncbi:hypothetical protein [Flavobacterium sp. GNP001]